MYMATAEGSILFNYMFHHPKGVIEKRNQMYTTNEHTDESGHSMVLSTEQSIYCRFIVTYLNFSIHMSLIHMISNHNARTNHFYSNICFH